MKMKEGGYWKFNNSQLKDQNYIKLVKDTISEVIQTYSPNNSSGNVENQPTEFSITDQLFFGNTFINDSRKYNKIQLI